jgi:GT2 family glycosyltransferase
MESNQALPLADQSFPNETAFSAADSRVCILIRTMGRSSLPSAVRSALTQTWPHVCVKLVVANGLPLAAEADIANPRVEIIHSADCLSRAAAANRALAAADTELALFLDDDDWLLPNHVERLLQALLAHPDAVAAHAGVECLRVSGGAVTSVRVFDEDISSTSMQLGNRLPIHSTLFRMCQVRQAPALRFNEGLEYFEDWDFWLQLMSRGHFVRVPGVSAVYQLDDDSGSGHEAGSSQKRQEMLEHFGKVQLGRWTPTDVAQLIEHDAHKTHVLNLRDFELKELRTSHQLQLELSNRQQHTLDQKTRQSAELLAEIDRIHRENADVQVDMRAKLADVRMQLDALHAQHRQLEAAHRLVIDSQSWRITRPLRAIRARIRAGLLRSIVKGITRALPVSPEARQRSKIWLSQSPVGSTVLQWMTGYAQVAVGQTVAKPALDKEVVRAEAEAELTHFLGSGDRINLHRSVGIPQVSVVIILYNQAGLSLQCLGALAHSIGVSFETIIVDNASSDRVPQLMDRMDGARILRQEGNLGFLRAVNLAAEYATGENLLLLNNDAIVEPHTLANAVARLACEPDAGAVGGPILLWDGSLQEAGSIIWRDGACLGYGRGDSPESPAYRFVRDVDYCSGAFLMVRRALFEQLGRFDDAFAPAYYEESDFCVRLWEAGHRVVYDPKVRVKHFEFASDAGSGQAMALQARNRKLFVAKHGAYLQSRPESDPSRVMQARQILKPGARRVLIIDDRVPLPDLGRGYPRAGMMASIIGSGIDALTYYPLQIADGNWDEVYTVLNPRTEVILDAGLAGLAKFLSSRVGQFDLILVSRPHNMEPVVALKTLHPDWFVGVKMVYDAEALFCLRTIERAKVLGQPLSEAKAKSIIEEELSLARVADRIVAVSRAEELQYRQAGCTDVVVLGHALTLQPSLSTFEQRQGFLFVGAITQDDCPNGDSVLWFVREVWPLIQNTLGANVELDIVGVCESAAVRALNSPTIRIHGRVADLGPFFERRRVFIAPTRYAAGVPHKAHEAASRGLPMVATPLIAGQLGWHEELLAADGPNALAQACLRLHTEPVTWQRVREAALAAVERDCSAVTFQRAVREIVR